MIKTRLFKDTIRYFDNSLYEVVTVDDQINEFLVDENVKYIDVKYSMSFTEENPFSSALLIYRLKEQAK